MDFLNASVLIPVISITVVVVVVVLLWGPVRSYFRTRETEQAMRLLRLQREQLEARFFDLASSQGKPRGLRWIDCDWQDRVTFARAVETGLLTAFVGVEIRFEAIEGGDMEDVEAVGNIRDASAVFHYQHGRWGTGGRALFNMNPEDAVERLEGQFVTVGGESRSG